MDLQIIYIFHNCFIVKSDRITFLFDYPDDRFLDENLTNLISDTIKDTQLYCFTSHSHSDHFNPDLKRIQTVNPQATFILSDDILGKIPSGTAKTLFVAPEQNYTIDQRLQLTTYQSSDLGVAFLINVNEKTIYYGGDLANWNWDELPPEEKKQMEQFYHRFLERLGRYSIDLAFVNADPRMKNWAGAEEFLIKIKPQWFIPMHTFGKTALLAKFLRSLKDKDKQGIFAYRQPGDTLEISL